MRNVCLILAFGKTCKSNHDDEEVEHQTVSYTLLRGFESLTPIWSFQEMRQATAGCTAILSPGEEVFSCISSGDAPMGNMA
jgi:hypothetical protein